MSKMEATVGRIILQGHIDGSFHGWEGNTLFLFTNGQIWQQSNYAYWYHYAYRPRAEIFDDGRGYHFRIQDQDRSIRVAKVR